MLNAIPDRRSISEIADGPGFLTPNEPVDESSDSEFNGQTKTPRHESISLGERRKSSVYSNRSGESSIELPQPNATVEAGKKHNMKIFLCFVRRMTYERRPVLMSKEYN